MLFIFVPLSDKKGFIVLQNVLLSVTLFSFWLLLYFFLSFLNNLLEKLFCFLHDHKRSAVSFKVLSLYLRSFPGCFPKVFCHIRNLLSTIFLLPYGRFLSNNAKNASSKFLKFLLLVAKLCFSLVLKSSALNLL